MKSFFHPTRIFHALNVVFRFPFETLQKTTATTLIIKQILSSLLSNYGSQPCMNDKSYLDKTITRLGKSLIQLALNFLMYVLIINIPYQISVVPPCVHNIVESISITI